MKLNKNITKNLYLWRGRVIIGLTIPIVRTYGRSNTGTKIVLHKGGIRTLIRHRLIDYKRIFINIPGIVRRIDYNRYNNGRILLICYLNGVLSYILAYSNFQLGDIICNFTEKNICYIYGNSSVLSICRRGLFIYSISGIYSRAIGTTSKFLGFIHDRGLIRLSSGKIKEFKLNTRISYGQVFDFLKTKSLKAGNSRHRGIRPSVRGVAMNPVDHPHGGGEGKSKGKLSVSPWGWLTKCARKKIK